ncbi:MAG: NifU family protein [Acidimicrobiales bacterium]
MAETLTEPILVVTDEALVKILELRAVEDGADGLGLRVAVTGVRGPEYSYDLSFEPLADIADDDLVVDQGGLPIVVPTDSADALRGATLDLPRNNDQGGLVLRNPNRPDPMAGLDIELTGDVAEKVTTLLEQVINPALDSHGGYAEFKGVDGDRVLVSMGGGCQGCAVSAMTLRQGIERTIKDRIPEITEVVDVTDHDAGANPFY